MKRALARSFAVALVSLGWATPSRAQEPSADLANRTAAEALFSEGKERLRAGRFAEACTKLAESQQLSPGAGTLLNLADCYEKNGQTASAWTEFRASAALARTKGQTEREQTARDRA